MDLAKAFDTVNHSILIRKLNRYGITGQALQILESYLRSRPQFVSIDNVNSKKSIVSLGVPQGSILGPLLFLIYINDLPKVTKFFIKLYADDTFLCLQNENLKILEEEVNFEIDKVFDWLNANHLSLNIGKSKFMLISKKKRTENFSIQINGNPLEKCDEYKYLGIYFDKDLNWNRHIEHICQKISQVCGA